MKYLRLVKSFFLTFFRKNEIQKRTASTCELKTDKQAKFLKRHSYDGLF